MEHDIAGLVRDLDPDIPMFKDFSSRVPPILESLLEGAGRSAAADRHSRLEREDGHEQYERRPVPTRQQHDASIARARKFCQGIIQNHALGTTGHGIVLHQMKRQKVSKRGVVELLDTIAR